MAEKSKNLLENRQALKNNSPKNTKSSLVKKELIANKNKKEQSKKIKTALSSKENAGAKIKTKKSLLIDSIEDDEIEDQNDLEEEIEKEGTKGVYTESSIQWYLEEINKIPLLTREEEDKLARAVTTGDVEAKNKLIVSNLRFVVQVAKKYQKYGISLLDLINEGNMGLIKAAERFDPDLGYHFISYAVWWIRQAIILAINQKASIIRLPMNRTIDLNRIEKIQKQLEHDLGHEPTLAQIAERLDIPEAEVKWLKQISSDYVSLDAPMSNDSENTQISAVQDDKYESPESTAMNQALSETINSILKELTVNERLIIEYRFGLNGKQRLSLTQAGKKFNLSKERVRQIEKKTLLKLQKYGRKKEIQAFLETE
ncbi:MAG: RNA polymerase sigma factor RpoD/SigA [Spirochaetia bacterium]|nr:RNA polymerase sigma factor RpoD/SigA [Spirochaetia bacterium]